mgnify:CR=1 FL=1
MANNCSNIVYFEGSKRKVKKANAIINGTASKELMEIMGDSFPYNIYVDDTQVSFESAWAPLFSLVSDICKHLEITASYIYEELGCDLYGVAEFFTDGSYDRTDLTEFPKWIQSKECYKMYGHYIHDDEYYDYLNSMLDQEVALKKFPGCRKFTKNKKYYANKLRDWAETFRDEPDDEDGNEDKTFENIYALAERLERGICSDDDFTQIDFHLLQQKGLS